MKKGEFIVGSINASGEISFSRKPVTHNNLITAKREAERLSKVDTSKKFIVVEVKGLVKAVDVVWE